MFLRPVHCRNGKTALKFVEDLHERISAMFAKDIEEICKFKAEATGSDNTTEIEPWEFSYWAEQRRRKLFDFDEEDVRPYFSIDRVGGDVFFTIPIPPRAASCSDTSLK